MSAADPLEVLLVEDSNDDALLSVLALERAGHRVHWHRVEDAAEMEQALAAQSWDVVLADHVLPAFDSFAALGVLSASGARTPLIVVSGAIGEATAVAAMRQGASDCVRKGDARLAAVVRTQIGLAEQRAARERIEEQFRSAFDDAPLASAVVAVSENPGQLLSANAEFVRVCGKTNLRLERLRVTDFVRGEQRRDLEEALAAMSDSRIRVHRAEVTLLEAGGDERWFTLSVSAFGVRDGLHAIVQLVDIHASKILAEELQLAHDSALEVARVKSEFVANMSHEIRTPLNGVIGLGDLLADSDLTADQRAYVNGIRSAGQALIAIVTEILDFSKLESGSVTLTPVDFEPAETVAEVIALMSAPAGAKQLRLTASVQADVPDVARADTGCIRRVLLNLVSNAVKFTDAGEVGIRLGVVDGDTQRLRFDVIDTGSGLDPDAQPFQPFWQADASLTRRHGGTGIGLTIARQMVDLAGGTIGFESVRGHGSCFWFTVSCELAHGSVGTPIDLTAVRALIVDDDANHREVTERQLSSLGAGLSCVDSAAEALLELRASAGTPHAYQIAVVRFAGHDTRSRDLEKTIRGDPQLVDVGVLLLGRAALSPGAAHDTTAEGVVSDLIGRSRLGEHVARVLGYAAPGAPKLATLAAAGETAGVQRVLVVDDDATNQLFASHLLRRHGWDVTVAHDGREGAALAADGTFDVILMDCQMPALDGYASTEEIRRHEDGRIRTPIIALTAHVSAKDRERCLASGMDDYLAKPFTAGELDAALGRVITRRQRSRVGAVRRARREGVLDRSRLAAISRSDPAAAEQLRNVFLRGARERIAALGSPEVQADGATVRALAHALKGSSATIGATRLAQACDRLTKVVAGGRLVDVPKRYAELEAAFALTETALNQPKRKARR
jgi:two-component system, sensor histidine kinase and response regulator